MKYKFFVFSDVHGEYEALTKALQEAGYDACDPHHKLISLGDNFDRGPDSAKVYNFLKQRQAICIKGNHDVMFQEYLEKGMDGEFVLFNIIHNGLGATIKSFSGNIIDDNNISVKDLENVRKHLRDSVTVLNWLKSLPLFFETKNCIFTHAGIDPRIPKWQETPEDFLLWDIEYSHMNCPYTNKKVFIGHHHAFRVRQNGENAGQKESSVIGGMSVYGNKDEHRPYFFKNKIAIDGCTNYTKKVNVVVFEDEMLDKEKTQENDNVVEAPSYTSVNLNGSTVTFNFNNMDANFYDYYDPGVTQATYTTRR